MIQNAKKRLLELEGKILLGLSGGPDSMCLCALLQELGKEFHIAHIDHGLQASSALEKNRLESFACQNKIPFHSITLDGKDRAQKNLEDVLRRKRLKFFKTVMEKEGLDLLVLGHQKDERAETIIKRFFEGSNILNLTGIKLFSKFEGIQVVRPLLYTTKKAVVDYLEKNGIKYFIDPTNFGTGNLRAKMRSSLLPLLEEEFGKNITASVCDLGDQIEGLSSYLDREISKIETIAVKGVMGVFYPYKPGVDDFLFHQLICKALRENNVSLSRQQREFLLQSISNKDTHKTLEFAQQSVHLEKNGVFIIDKSKSSIPYATVPKNISWLEFWRKGTDIEGFKEISPETFNRLLTCKQRSDFHRRQKTPLCLRRAFPIPLTSIRKMIKINVEG